MGAWIELKPQAGQPLSAWRADPKGKPLGGIVVIQEIFGVNAHIRSLADRFAAEGYLAVAPAMFDQVEKGVDWAVDAETMQKGIALAGKLDREQIGRDVAAAIAIAKEGGKVGVVGFCFGGTVAWASAARAPALSAAVGYYGGGILGLKDLTPRAPTMLHFGELDAHIPMDGVRELQKLHPEVAVYSYPAGHAFNRDGNAAYHEESAKVAWKRTLDFFRKHLG